MTSAPHSPRAAHRGRHSFALSAVIAQVRRGIGEHPALVAAVAVVLWGGGVAGAVLALNSLGAVRPAAAATCPAPGPPYFAYAVPQDPAHPSAAGSGASNWGWQPHVHPLKAGNWVRGMDGQMWKVTGIVAMPGVEPVCRPFGIIGLGSANSPFNKGLVMAGRLVLRPVG